MHVHNPICRSQLKEIKIIPITLKVWALGRMEKCLKRVKKWKKIFFFVSNKYQSVTHVSLCIFQGLFKNIVFRWVCSFSHKKVLGYFRFYSQTELFLNLKKIFFYKKSLKELSFCHKLAFSNPYIFATLWCKPLIFQT